MNVKKGMAGLILLVMVIGYMMAISTSSTMLIQTESTGKFARQGYKNAYYAAISGIGAVMSMLRAKSAATFDSNESNRPYFVRTSPDSDNHYCNYTSPASNQTYSGYSTLIAPGWISVSTPFVVNIEVDPSNYLFQVCTYPGDDPITGTRVYYVKSQGKYIDPSSAKEFYSQVWAKFTINAPAKLLSLNQFGTMGVQSLTLDTTSGEINDFWDWQNDFQ